MAEDPSKKKPGGPPPVPKTGTGKPTPPPVPEPEPIMAELVPLPHLLRDPQFLGIFIDVVDEAAKKPNDPGHNAALWLKPQLDDIEKREDLIRMYEKMGVLARLQDRDLPSKHAGKKEVKDFLGMLTPDQKTDLINYAITEDRSRLNPRRLTNPQHLGGMSRRAFLGTAAAIPLGGMAISYHNEASRKTKQAINPPKPPVQPGREDEFFGEDPRNVAEQPQNQQLLAQARQDEISAGAYGVAAGASAAYGLANLAKRLYTPHSARFRNEVRSMLVTMDSLVKDAALEAYRQKDGPSPA